MRSQFGTKVAPTYIHKVRITSVPRIILWKSDETLDMILKAWYYKE